MIDKIDGLGSIRTTQTIKRPVKTDSASGSGFSKHLDETSETSATGTLGNTNAVSGILGIQEVDDALSSPSKGKARASNILDLLDNLRMELLAGTLTKDKLMQLSRIVNARRSQVTDPKLAAVLDEIDLRAQVELAKYTS